MKMIRRVDGGGVQIIDAVNVQKTLQIFSDAVELVGDFPDEFFRDAWEMDGNGLSVDLVKAKSHCHAKRREKRESLFEPHDKKISAQIPNTNTDEIEKIRQEIRLKDAQVQLEIDSCNDLGQLKLIIETYLESE